MRFNHVPRPHDESYQLSSAPAHPEDLKPIEKATDLATLINIKQLPYLE